MPQTVFRTIVRILALSALLAAPALAQHSPDQVQINHDIVLDPGVKARDLVCVNCSIFVRGETAGDVVAIHGNVVIEPGGHVAGGVTTVLGDLRLQNTAQVGGDAVTVGGIVRREPEATVGGNVTALGGAGWTLLIVFLPLAFVGAMAALIVWLIARARRPAPIAA
jgi:hypothetical protein